MSKRRAPGAHLAAVVHEPREILGAGARHPRLLDRHAALVPLRCDVEVAEAVRPHQPLVADGDEEVRLHDADVDRMRAGGLARVHDERGTGGARRCADALEVHQGAVGPVTDRRGDERDVAGVERGDDRVGPGRAGARASRCARARRCAAPARARCTRSTETRGRSRGSSGRRARAGWRRRRRGRSSPTARARRRSRRRRRCGRRGRAAARRERTSRWRGDSTATPWCAPPTSPAAVTVRSCGDMLAQLR